MKLIIGLGNPGREYEGNRHNVGFQILDELVKELELEDFKAEKKFHALVTQGTHEGEKFIFAKPQTYMNLSGESAIKIAQFYKIPLQDTLVVYDELDLPLGKIRVRPNGSAGTHNGLKSLVQHLGSSNFPRLRFGIESRGTTAPQQQNTSDFVLSDFRPEEFAEYQKIMKQAKQATLDFLHEDMEKLMQKYN